MRSVIEVKISPEREGGFDRLAQRISKFNEVEACHLMSGAYDLLVIVKGKIYTLWRPLFLNGLPLLRECSRPPLIFCSVLTRSTVTCLVK